MMYTAPYVMFLMRADPLQGQVGGGWALEIETFLVPEMATSEASAFGPKKVENTQNSHSFLVVALFRGICLKGQ
jgi:hypothetical protein